jgi:hypothetical protein
MRFWNCNIPLAVALVLAATVVACGTPPPPAVVTASAAAVSTGNGFDGTYRGEAFPDQIIEGCGEASHAVILEVKGDRIWVRHSHALTGTVDPAGEVSMQNSDATSNLTGSIQGDVLKATETTTRSPKKLQGFYVDSESTCTFAIQATRESGGDSDGAP